MVLPLEAEEYLGWLAAERGRAPATLAAYRRDLRRYQGWLQDQGLDLGGVDEATVSRFVAELRAFGLAPASVTRTLVAVRSLHRFLTDEGLADHDPARHTDLPKVPAGLPKALTEDEVARLLDAVTGEDAPARRDRALLELLYGTGARISEVTGLSLPDLDLDAGLVRLFGKGAKERIVPLGRLARSALLEWLGPGGRPVLVGDRPRGRDDTEALFVNQRGGRLSRQGAWGVVRRYGDQVGLGDRLTPHVLRHSCATHMLDRGADIRAVQEFLGHASISTTQVYTKVAPERLRRVYDQAHPRARR